MYCMLKLCAVSPQLGEELSGVVEVIGMVSNKGAIMATTYNMLREDKGITFGGSSFIVGYIQMNTAAFICGDLQRVLSIRPQI